MPSPATSPIRRAASSEEEVSEISSPATTPLANTTSMVKDDGLSGVGADVESEQGVEGEGEDDIEMDHKFRGLTNLLKTSSVFVAIMADKMKEQQKRNADQARKVASKAKVAQPAGDATAAPARRSTRTQATEDQSHNEVSNDQVQPKRGRGKSSKNGTGSTKSDAKKGRITDYLDKGLVDVKQNGPSVQEALAEAADEYDAKGEALGAQDLIATDQPKLVTGGAMREYQLEGLEWLKGLWMNGLCGILADEMGLGKTVQAISMIAFFKENNISGPFLIAAPLSTVRNWIEEFKFWTPEIKTILYHGSKDERAEMRRKHLKMQEQGKFDFPVVVTSYEICMNDKAFLGNYRWRYIIVDEGHRLKNMNCRLIKELMTYNSANRLLITGTPLQNNIAELWSLLHFLLPEVFNDLDSFEGWFDFSSVLEDRTDSDGKAKKRKNNLVSTMHAILKPFLLRRIKSDVESSLPQKREYILYAPLTDEQKELYREILAGTSRNYLEEKAVERIETKSRAQSLKRKAVGSGRTTPAKSVKASREATPASVASASSTRRGRKAKRQSYKDVTDGQFNAKLRRLERGEDDEGDEQEELGASVMSDTEADEQERAQTLKLAKQEIAKKKLQNPVMQARLACNSPHNFYWPWQPSKEDPDGADEIDETLVTASGKLMLLDVLLPRLFELGHKVLIFSQFKTTLDILETYALSLRGWEACRIDGSISQDDRYEQITAFNTDPSYKLFLLSTRAGGQGINLTSADTVILFDSDWNPQQDLQAMDRAHRIGQKRPVIVYRFATRGTVEETLLFKADAKRRLEKLVIQKGKFRSLFDGVDAKTRKMKGSNDDNISQSELKGVLTSPSSTTHNNEDTNTKDVEEEPEYEFEKYDVRALESSKGGKLLSEKELAILTDRSDKAYERASKGIDVGGDDKDDVFKVAETKRGGGASGGFLEDLTTRKKPKKQEGEDEEDVKTESQE